MKPLRSFLDRLEPLFTKGGRFEGLYALFEAVDTFFYSPGDLTRGSPHVRDAIDLKRVMILVVIASTPAALMGMWNVGFQANSAMQSLGTVGIDGWRGVVLSLLGAVYDPASVYDNFLQGALYFVPIYVVTMVVGLSWEILFAGVRNHEVNEGFFVTSLLYALILPATIPLWQVAVGISFGVVIGKEVFGGTGKNFLNPALVGRAFVQAAFPVAITTWHPALLDDRFTTVATSVFAWPFMEPQYDVISGATPLAAFKFDGVVTPTMDLAFGQIDQKDLLLVHQVPEIKRAFLLPDDRAHCIVGY